MAVQRSRNYAARFIGGLDTETPSISLPPGRLADALNYEVGLNGGYRDIDGYRRIGGAVGDGNAPVQSLFVLNDRIHAVKGGLIHRLKSDETSWEKAWPTDASKTWIGFYEEGTRDEGIPLNEELTGASSSATFEVVYTRKFSGNFGTEGGGSDMNDAKGYFVAKGLEGTITEDEDVNLGAGKAFKLDGGLEEISLPASAKISWDRGTFGGEDYVFLASGAGHAMRWDGEWMVPAILDSENPSAIRPVHVLVNESRLFLSHGSSFFYSALGAPLNFSTTDGAAEVNVGSEVTAMLVEPGHDGSGSASIFSKDVIHVLRQDLNGNKALFNYRREIGAIPLSAQTLSESVFADEWGIRMLRTSEEFGNFAHSTLSRRIQSRWEEAISGRSVAGSMISRLKSQYRIFFDDGTGFYATIVGRNLLGVMPVRYADRPSCFLSREFEEVGERMFFGTSDGRVMEMDRGRSFDGQRITSWFVTHLDYMRSMGLNKSAKDMSFEAHASGTFMASVMLMMDFLKYDGLLPRIRDIAFDGDGVIRELVGEDRFEPSEGNQMPAGAAGMTLPINVSFVEGEGENASIAIGKSSASSHPVTWGGYRIRHTLDNVVSDRAFLTDQSINPRTIGPRVAAGRDRRATPPPPLPGDRPRTPADDALDDPISDHPPGPTIPTPEGATAPDRPDPPIAQSIGKNAVDVTFVPPNRPGTSDLAKFSIRYSGEGGIEFFTERDYDSSNPRPVVRIDGLVPSTRYSFVSVAINREGLSSLKSLPSHATTDRESVTGYAASD